jgi:transcriptional regulator with XRE-family HTH domain
VPEERKALSYNEIIGERLRTLRERAGLTQADLAKALGTKQANISNTERGIGGITVRRLARLSQVLRASPNEILGDPQFGENLSTATTNASWGRRFRKISSLSPKKRDALAQIIDAFLKT